MNIILYFVDYINISLTNKSTSFKYMILKTIHNHFHFSSHFIHVFMIIVHFTFPQ